MKSVAETRNHPHQFDAIKKLCTRSHVPENKDFVIPLLAEMIRTPGHTYASEALEQLFDIGDKDFVRDILTEVILRPGNSAEHEVLAYQALKKLFKGRKTGPYGSIEYSEQDLERGISLIPYFSKTPFGWGKMLELLDEIKSDKKTNKKIQEDIFEKILENPEHPYIFEALSNLWDLGRYEEVRPHIIKIAENPEHPNNGDAILKLFESSYHDDRKITLPFWPDFAKTELGWKTLQPHIRSTNQIIKENNNKIEKDSYAELTISILENILGTENHPRRNDLILLMWDLEFDCKEIELLKLQILLEKMAERGHAYEYDAAVRLFNQCDLKQRSAQRRGYGHGIRGSISSQNTAINNPYSEALERFFADTNYPRRYEVALKLFYISKDKQKALSILSEIAQEPNHPHRYDAAVKIWILERGAYQHAARLAIIGVAQTPDDSRQADAIRLLRESNNEGDQQLGAELQYRFFPVELAPETKLSKEQFNLDAIRAAMPARLADLSRSAEFTNDWLYKKFNELMDKISPDEYQRDEHGTELIDETVEKKVNPFYLEMSAITGGDVNISLENLKIRMRGFLKTLLNMPLEYGENHGWQMYEDVKPNMINALKHLAIAIDLQLVIDAQTALLNLSTVLNGMLYCPTGQAEGIQTAVNAIINFKNTLSSDFRELIGKKVIAKTVVQTFNNAFNQQGRVHASSRARTALNPELRISNALPEFKERISPVSDHDIPHFFNEFYAHFTPANIISEFNRNLQTPDQFRFVSEHPNHHEAKRIKESRPFNVGMIGTWLHDQKVSSEDILKEYDMSLLQKEFRKSALQGKFKVSIKQSSPIFVSI